MSNLLVYSFEFPQFQPAPPDIARNMRLSLARQISFKTFKNQYSFETQDTVGECFRETVSWHIDNLSVVTDIDILKFTGVILCATSTPPIFAEGRIGVDPKVHKSFGYSRHNAYSAIHRLAFELGNENWMDDLIEGNSEPEEFIGVHVLEEFEFIQARPFEIAKGLVQKTLHKSAPREAEDPEQRTFFRSVYDFRFL